MGLPRLRKLGVRLATAATLAAAVPLIQVPAADAVGIVSCAGGSGGMAIGPAVLNFPNPPQAVNISGSTDSDGCTGAGGSTDAVTTFSGTILNTTCILNTIVGVTIGGTGVIAWAGGTGEPTTTFSWTIEDELNLGPTTAVTMYGHTTSGRYHKPGQHATLISITLNLAPTAAPCAAATQIALSNPSITVLIG